MAQTFNIPVVGRSLNKATEAGNSFQKKQEVYAPVKQAVNGYVSAGHSHEFGPILNLDNDYFTIKEIKKTMFPAGSRQRKWYRTYARCEKHVVFQKIIGMHIHHVAGIRSKGKTGGADFAKHRAGNLLNLN